MLVVVLLWNDGANADRIAGITRAEADSLGRETVIYNGLPVTFNTLSRDLLKKVSGSVSYRGLSAEQVVSSLKLFPLEWKDEPLIIVKDKDLAQRFGATGNRLALSSLFDSDGSYKVDRLYAGAEGKRLRAVEELDEKAGILLGIMSGELIVKKDWVVLPEWRIDLELLYNRIPLLKILFIFLFSGSFILGIVKLLKLLRFRDYRKEHLFYRLILGIAFTVSLLNFVLEWILAGRIPLSNMGETLNFTILAGLGLMLFYANTFPLGLFFWGCVALVAWLTGENPVVTPLMPALQSPWLSIHVTLVMASYSLLALTFLFSLLGLWGRKSGDRLLRPCMMTLRPGVILLTAGIVTGSIWAKEAWGAYWSWDPKETWALITLALYSIPLFFYSLPSGRQKILPEKYRVRALYIYLLFAFLSVLMTYFGVTYFLGGKHSYV